MRAFNSASYLVWSKQENLTLTICIAEPKHHRVSSPQTLACCYIKCLIHFSAESRNAVAEPAQATATSSAATPFPWQQEQFMFDSSEDEDLHMREKMGATE